MQRLCCSGYSLIRLISLWLFVLFTRFTQMNQALKNVHGDLPDPEGLFYIYNWSESYDNVYPATGSVLHPESPYDHGFQDNEGAGKLLSKNLGLFQTWQFSMYRNAIARLKHSRFRTMDPTQATAFILPFDAGVHSYIDHVNGKKRLASPHAWSVRAILKHVALNETLRKIFWKNNGHDHFVFFSLTAFVMTGIGVKEFWTDICQNCTAITLETTPTLTSTTYHRSRKYWYAAPYPSSFHWHEDIPALPWAPLLDERQYGHQASQNDVTIEKYFLNSLRSFGNPKSVDSFKVIDPSVVPRKRDIFALFIGSVKTLNPKANRLRRKLQQQCALATLNSSEVALSESAEIKHRGQRISISSNMNLNPLCQWHSTAHSCNALANLTAQMSLFRRSIFCPAPPGDTVTRKSLFDSLVSGCIPVIFAKASLLQYAWYISPTDLEAISVYIPISDINQRKVNFLEVLGRISVADVRLKQEYIAKVAPRLQYSVVPSYIRSGTMVGGRSIDLKKSSADTTADARAKFKNPTSDATINTDADYKPNSKNKRKTAKSMKTNSNRVQRRYRSVTERGLDRRRNLAHASTLGISIPSSYHQIPIPVYEFDNASIYEASFEDDYTRYLKAHQTGIISSNTPLTWDPPFDDAVTVMIRRMLDPVTVQPLHGFTDEELRRHKCLSNKLMLFHQDYSSLFYGTSGLGGASGNVFRKLKCDEITFVPSTTPLNMTHNCFRKGEAEFVDQYY